MKRTLKSNVPDFSSESTEEKTTDGDGCDPQEESGLAPEPENFSGSFEASFEEIYEELHDSILEDYSFVARPSPVDFSQYYLDVVVGKDNPSTLVRQRADSTRGGPDRTGPHHSGFEKESKKPGTTGAEPQTASQATEDIQEKHEGFLPSVSDDEEEASSSRNLVNLLSGISFRPTPSGLSLGAQNTSLENPIFNCPESSNTIFSHGMKFHKIISTPYCCSIERPPKTSVFATVNFGGHQRTSEKVNPPVASVDYTDTFDKLSDLTCREKAVMEAQGEKFDRPVREHQHPGPVHNSLSSLWEDMVKIRSVKFSEWKPEVPTETDGTEEDDNNTDFFSELSNEKMDLHEPAEAVRSSINRHLVQAPRFGFSRTVRPALGPFMGAGMRYIRKLHLPFTICPHRCPSVTQETSADINISTRAWSLSNVKLQSSFKEFIPDFTDNKVFKFQCSSPGLHQCRETGLVFDMKAEGDVFYKIVPWNRTLLSQHHKKPAGPLFDLTCHQQSVAQLHLPHCEVRSTGGGDHLSVVHIDHDDLELIRPERITETHVVVNVTGFSAFGNVKDKVSPLDQVQALVLLFYKLPAEPDADYQINVLLLPRNVAVGDVLRFRKKLDETFLDVPPHCKLQPQQVYSLSTGSGDDSVLVQPTEAKFDQESYNCFLTTFQVVYKTPMKHMKLFLRDSSSTSVWERLVCLSSSGTNQCCGSTCQNHRPDEQLSEARVSFIDGVSGPVLQSLLDRLLESKVLSDSEREAAEAERNRRDKARFVIDTVKRKGDAAGSEMIHYLCELNPYLSEHLGFM